jgi:hypothetical protein
MASQSQNPNLINLLFHIHRHDGMQRSSVDGKDLDPNLASLRSWQSNRLAGTYQDFLSDPDYQQACTFFLTDIYGPKDFTQRDFDFDRLYSILSRFIPEHMLRLLAEAIALNRMSMHLDEKLLHAILSRWAETAVITPEMVAEAYRLCNNYDERLHQIEQLVRIMDEAIEGAKYPLVGPTLRFAKGPAVRLGWQELYNFLDRAYKAFRPMRGPQRFTQAIYVRELAILNQIFEGRPDPFQVSIMN